MSGQKSEKPTPRRLSDARKKGEAARSKEVVSAAVVAVCLFFIVNGTAKAMRQISMLMNNILQNINRPITETLAYVTHEVLITSVLITAPLILSAVAVSLAAGISQTGFIFTLTPLKPDLKRLNPASNAAKIVAPENLAMAGASLIKVFFLAVLFWFVIKNSLNGLCFAPMGSQASMAKTAFIIMKRLTIDCTVLFIVLAAADFLLQKKLFIKRLMMSKQEVKDEHKESEGDPYIRSLREQRREEILAQSGSVVK